MRALISSFLSVLALAAGTHPSFTEELEWVLDGVIVAENPAHSIALVRRVDAKRARPLKVGQEHGGYVLLEVTKRSVLMKGKEGELRLFLGSSVPVHAELESPAAPRESEREWIQRDFSRSQAQARLEKEIPVILSDTEVTPRVEEGEVRGLELLRLPDGTLLSETGLLPGDVLRSINEEPLRGLDSLWKILARYQNADELRVVVERRGEVVHFAYAFTN